MPADEWRRRRDVEELRGLFARGRAMLGSPPMDPQTLAEARADIIELDSRQRHIVEALLRLVRLRVLRGEDVGRE